MCSGIICPPLPPQRHSCPASSPLSSSCLPPPSSCLPPPSSCLPPPSSCLPPRSSCLRPLFVMPAHPPRHSCPLSSSFLRRQESRGARQRRGIPTTSGRYTPNANPSVRAIPESPAPNPAPVRPEPVEGPRTPCHRLLAPARWPTLPCPHGSRTQPPRKDPRPPGVWLPKAGNCFTTIASLALDLYLQCVTTATKRMHKHEPSQLRPTRKVNVQKSPPQLRPARKTMSLDAAPTLIIHPKAEAGIRAVARWLLVIPDASITENCVWSGKIHVKQSQTM